MAYSAKAAGFVGILGAALAIGSDALPATQLENAVPEDAAVMTELDATTSALTYWASESDGWHVVTTVDAVAGRGDAERHVLVRFSSVLQPGQSQLISVPLPVGERQQVLRIRRVRDQVEVVRVAGSSV
jgi:hypothetical protein